MTLNYLFILKCGLFEFVFQTKFSHLDVVGRPVVVLEKINVVPEHNQYFQVTYNSLSSNFKKKIAARDLSWLLYLFPGVLQI